MPLAAHFFAAPPRGASLKPTSAVLMAPMLLDPKRRAHPGSFVSRREVMCKCDLEWEVHNIIPWPWKTLVEID